MRSPLLLSSPGSCRRTLHSTCMGQETILLFVMPGNSLDLQPAGCLVIAMGILVRRFAVKATDSADYLLYVLYGAGYKKKRKEKERHVRRNTWFLCMKVLSL